MKVIVAMIVWCLLLTSCSGSKQNFSAADVAGYYNGVDEYSAWTFMLDESGIGYESAYYPNKDLTIMAPFSWTLNGNSLTLNFEMDEIMITGDTETDAAEAIVKSMLSGYAEPRICTIKKDKNGTVFVDGEGLYPMYCRDNSLSE